MTAEIVPIFKKEQTLAEVVERAVAENPEALDGIVIVFNRATGGMTTYFHADYYQMAFAAVRLTHRAATEMLVTEVDDAT